MGTVLCRVWAVLYSNYGCSMSALTALELSLSLQENNRSRMQNKVGHYHYLPYVVSRQLQPSYNCIDCCYNMEQCSSGTMLLIYNLEAAVRLPIWDLSTLKDFIRLLISFQIML